MAKTSEKLELISSLGESLSQKELQLKELSEKLLQSELSVSVSLSPRSHCFCHVQLSSFVLCLPCSWKRSPRNSAARRNSAQS